MQVLREANHLAPGHTAPAFKAGALPQRDSKQKPQSDLKPLQVPTCNQCLWLRQPSLSLASWSSVLNDSPTSRSFGSGEGVYDPVQRLSRIREGAGAGWESRLCLYVSLAEKFTLYKVFQFYFPRVCI